MNLLAVNDLIVEYATPAGAKRAVSGVTFHIERGESLGLVGESSCGKSTLGRAILGLESIKSGSVRFDGVEISGLPNRRLKPFRRRIQMIYQDPFGSLNPRRTIGKTLAGPLSVHGIGTRAERQIAVMRILESVGLPHDAAARFPHEFSGGQRQRIGIARALILQPELLICDEPVSALDLSVQAQIINLLVELKRTFGLSYLFISHDLSVVRFFADRILVMYLGRVVETATTEKLWVEPRHPYTATLIDSIPDGKRRGRVQTAGGEAASGAGTGRACPFEPRCALAIDRCRSEPPVLRTVAEGHAAACHRAELVTTGRGTLAAEDLGGSA